MFAQARAAKRRTVARGKVYKMAPTGPKSAKNEHPPSVVSQLLAKMACVANNIVRKIIEQSIENRTKIDRKSMKNRPKSSKNRFWAGLGAQGRVKDASRRARGGIRTPKSRSKVDLGTPRARQNVPETSISEPEAAPRRLRTVSVRCPSACGASNTGERARGTIFWRFCVFPP